MTVYLVVSLPKIPCIHHKYIWFWPTQESRRTHTHAHTYTHSRTQIHTLTHMQPNTNTLTHTYAQTHTYTNAYTHKYASTSTTLQRTILAFCISVPTIADDVLAHAKRDQLIIHGVGCEYVCLCVWSVCVSVCVCVCVCARARARARVRVFVYFASCCGKQQFLARSLVTDVASV